MFAFPISRRPATRRAHSRRRPLVEVLEGRQLLSVAAASVARPTDQDRVAPYSRHAEGIVVAHDGGAGR